MPPDREFCSAQMARLSGLPGYPKTDEAKRSFIEALHGAFAFAGADALRRWIQDALETCDRCPLPRDVYGAGREASPPKPRLPITCFHCYDTGVASVEFLLTWERSVTSSVRLTAEQAALLWEKHRQAEVEASKADPEQAGLIRRSRTFSLGRQMIYSAAAPCDCRMARAAAPAPSSPAPTEWLPYAEAE